MYCLLSIDSLGAVVAHWTTETRWSKKWHIAPNFPKKSGAPPLPPPTPIKLQRLRESLWNMIIFSSFNVFSFIWKNVDCEISLFKEIKWSFGLLSTIELKRWCRSAIMKIHEARTRELTRYQSQPLFGLATPRGRECVAWKRPNNDCEGEHSKRGTNAVHFYFKLLRQKWQPVSEFISYKLDGSFFLSIERNFCWKLWRLMLFFFCEFEKSVAQCIISTFPSE